MEKRNYVARVVLVCLLALVILVISVKARAQEPNGKYLKDTTIKNATYKLYQGPKGGKFYMRNGKKVYLPKPKGG